MAVGNEFSISGVEHHPWLIPAAESLGDAHQFWHEAAAAYHEPSEFRRHLEAMVQAARNVTFRLQSGSSDSPVGLDWYLGENAESWRSLMKDDSRMVWLNDSRVEITKRRGIERASFALVLRVEGYFEPQQTLLRVPAHVSTDEIVAQAIGQIPEEFRPNQAVELFRRWESPSLGGEEVLTAMRECLRVLAGVLLFGVELSSGRDPVTPSEFLEGVEEPDCMMITPDLIPRTHTADTGERFELGFEPTLMEARMVEEGVRRYGGQEAIGRPPDGLEERARWTHGNSGRLWKKDGALLPLAFLRDPSGEWDLFAVPSDSKRTRYLTWRELGVLALVRGYDAVIATAEMWIAQSEGDPQPYVDVSVQPGVQEIIGTHFLDKSGRGGFLHSKITRVGPLRMLSKTVILGIDQHEATMFDPVRRAWRTRDRILATSGLEPSDEDL